MTTREVAEMLCVTVFSVRNLVREGALPAIRFTDRSRLRFRRSEVDALLRRRARSADQRAAFAEAER